MAEICVPEPIRPSPLKPATPVPTTVVIWLVAGLIRRIRLLFESEM